MKSNPTGNKVNNFQIGLASPARRALTGAGITLLTQLTRLSERELSHLHGIGPNALKQLRLALAARGLRFATEKQGK